MKVNANEIKFVLLFFGCKTSPLHWQMGTQSADIQHLNTDYTSIETKLQQCVNHVSFALMFYIYLTMYFYDTTLI